MRALGFEQLQAVAAIRSVFVATPRALWLAPQYPPREHPAEECRGLLRTRPGEMLKSACPPFTRKPAATQQIWCYNQCVKWRRSYSILLLLIVSVAIFYGLWEGHLEQSQDDAIRLAAQRYGVQPALVKAIVWRESRFNPAARGRVGEIGLMQLREEAAQEWADAEHIRGFAHEQCYNPMTNALAGTWYFKKLLQRYQKTDNPVPYALADYNAGRGNVLKWLTGEAATNSATFIDQIPFPGTKDYVQSILGRFGSYGH